MLPNSFRKNHVATKRFLSNGRIIFREIGFGVDSILKSLERGLEEHRSGRLERAESLYRQVLNGVIPPLVKNCTLSIGALLGAVVVLLLQMRGGRIRLVSAQSAIPAITVAPIAEELLFRAALFALLTWLFDPLPKPWARVGTILGAALLFACPHEVYSPVRFLTLLLTPCPAIGYSGCSIPDEHPKATARPKYTRLRRCFQAPGRDRLV